MSDNFEMKLCDCDKLSFDLRLLSLKRFRYIYRIMSDALEFNDMGTILKLLNAVF